jgi:hypothetical protein
VPTSPNPVILVGPTVPDDLQERLKSAGIALMLGRIRSQHHSRGVLHLPALQLLASRVRATIVIFPPGTTEEEATGMVRYFAWSSWPGLSARATIPVRARRFLGTVAQSGRRCGDRRGALAPGVGRRPHRNDDGPTMTARR